MENIEVVNAQPGLLGIIDDTKSHIYEKLWNLCAGPLCDLPKLGEKVYYFPQGHIELVEASTREELDQMRPIFDLPSKLRCQVVAIERKVVPKTDELYAEISLMPDTVQVIIPIDPNGDQERPIFHSFVKVLTASDTSTHGGLSVLRRHAIECLPPLDMSQQVPSQEIVAKDLYGHTWKFKHVYRGTPQRHLFTTGWSAFATAKKLVTGDSFVFVSGENGELRVGIRRARHQQDNIPSSIISIESMQHGVIASAANALKNKCLLIAIYKPRSSQYVVSYDKFVDAVNNNFNIGSRFRMRFEGEDFTEKRYSGTVIGVNDFSPHWKNSEWRSLQVQWDEIASFPRPDRVSPWEIEHFMPSSNVLQPALLKKKRSRQVNEIGSTSSNPWTPILSQDQEIGQPSMSNPISIHQLGNREAIEDSKFPSGWLMGYSVPTMPAEPNNNNDQIVQPMKEKITTDATTSCKLFGVDLATPSETKVPMGPIESYQKSEISKLSQEKKLDPTQTLTSPKEVQSKQFNSTRSRTKVQMQGVAIGRAVDLTVLNGYNQLIQELEKLFDLNGELQTRNHWEMVFTDNEGDTMLVGDDPWPEFCNMVKKIFICSKEEVKKITSENKISPAESTILTSSDVLPDVTPDN